jgi:hypothetical protein
MPGPRFLEILKCNGVDQDAVPYPGMIVPFLGENQILLETSGFDVAVPSPARGYKIPFDLAKRFRQSVVRRRLH